MRAAVDCRGTDQEAVREGTVMGNACGRKVGSQGSKVITAESHVGVGAITTASLYPHASTGS